MTTITLILLCFAVTAAVMYLLDKAEQRSKRRDRDIVRRLHTYMAQVPPAGKNIRRPW